MEIPVALFLAMEESIGFLAETGQPMFLAQE